MRIVAISDLHGYLPPVPPCDLLVVVGDLCPDHVDGSVHAREEPGVQLAWMRSAFRTWMDRVPLPASHKVCTWGNHDFAGEGVDAVSLGRELGITLAIDEVVTPGGMRVWVSPWCNPLPGDWAFVKPVEQLREIYRAIPADVDIIATHQPPFGFGDLESTGPGRLEHVGSAELLAAVERVRPQLVLCGHIQRAAGVYAHQGVPIYNVSVLDGGYEPTNAVTVLDVEPRAARA